MGWYMYELEGEVALYIVEGEIYECPCMHVQP